MSSHNPIGVFDSGVGGISTLATLTKQFPDEQFIFYGDTKYAPYGSKSAEEVYQCAKRVVEELLTHHIKALVIACNTATSAAKTRLMADYPDLPIVGIEPALKEAIDAGHHDILVMGTKLTVHLPKFQSMVEKYQNTHRIYGVACPGLADYIEGGMTDNKALMTLLHQLLADYLDRPVDGIVLGCTHYPFVKAQIQSLFPKGTPVYTGYLGVAHQLQRVLNAHDLLTDETGGQTIEWLSSQPGSLDYYQTLYNRLQ